ncbi:hypothetical protein K7X08_030818 [Anisodus acutangulus]|uniref:Uncharacterized protein n=1 Tax=Anisodus acutangulus TaxID=402998 RepID=A0A9Q1M2F0_9SOLA|nr:hypothetical protein K7X08_030818 [Anisodus acutangulus]
MVSVLHLFKFNGKGLTYGNLLVVAEQMPKQSPVEVIDFSALLEVRLVNSTPGQAGVPGGVIEGSAANESTPVLGSSKKKTETPVAGAGEVSNGKQTQSTPSENGGVNLWEQFSDTIKAELSQESSWGKPSPGKSPRPMRGTALGPTMAFLRSQKKI